MFSLELPSAIATRLKSLDRDALLAALAGLLLSPEHHAHVPRIFTVLHWALAGASGHRMPSKAELFALFAALNDHPSRPSEDPPETLFTDAVWSAEARFCIFPGLYVGGVFHLQRLLTAAAAQPPANSNGVRQAMALLALSDALVRRCGYQPGLRHQSVAQAPIRPAMRPMLARGVKTIFSANALADLAIRQTDLEPFLLGDTRGLLEASFGQSALELRPLVALADGVRVVHPGGLAAAAAMHLVTAIGPAAARGFYDRDYGRWLLVDLPRAGAKPLPGAELGLVDPGWKASLTEQVAALQFDADKRAHLVVLQSNWPQGLDPPPPYPLGGPTAFGVALKVFVEDLHSLLARADPEAAGLTLVVYNSPGWRLELPSAFDLGERWPALFLSAYAFDTLLKTPEFELLDLWKLYAEARQISAKGIPIVLPAEPLDAWSAWDSLGRTFAPQLLDIRGHGMVVDSGATEDLVAQTRALRAQHAVSTPDGDLALVERFADLSESPVDFVKPIYVPPLELATGTLIGVVETDFGPWWVKIGRPAADPEDQQFLGLLWQATTQWLVAASHSAVGRLTPGDSAVLITLVPIPETITDGPNEAQFFGYPDSAEIRIATPANLMSRMTRVDNGAEIEVLTWILEGLMRLKGREDGADPTQWARELLANPDLKMIHVTREPDLGHQVDLTLPQKTPYRLLQAHDVGAAARWMDDALVAANAVSPAELSSPIFEPTPVNAILKAAVDVHWAACRARLVELDRGETVALVSRLIEGLHRRRVIDERAALARAIAYSDDPGLGIRQTNERDRTFRTYRVVAEMALCACPRTGGREPGFSDIDAIAAQVNTMVRTAEQSDAVVRGLVAPGARFLPDGSLAFVAGGTEAFMQDYLRACLDEVVREDEEGYAARYDVAAPASERLQLDDADGFETAVEAEFGLPFTAILALTMALQHVAADRLEEAPKLRRSELLEALKPLPERFGNAFKLSDLDAFLAAFGLPVRPAWDKAPIGFRPDDIFPWFFERRLSLMVRPVLVLDEGDDPELVFGVRQVLMGVRYALLLLELGVWEKPKLRSGAAKDFVDAEVQRRGDTFEFEVRDLFRAAQWTAKHGLSMRQLGADKSYGDLDVLGVSPDGTVWRIVECKWFGAARTPREVAGWMQDFRGHDGDKLDKHLRRCRWIRENVDAVARVLKLTVPSRVEGRIATTRPVPLAFVHQLPDDAVVVTRRQLKAEVSDFASRPSPVS